MEVSLLGYYLIERIIDEKEKKLNDFIVRQGISKKEYIFSWFVTFFILSLLPFAAFLSFGGFFFVYRYQFYVINLVLYMISTYSVMFFAFSIFSSIRLRTTIIKIFNFSTIFLGATLSAPKIGRIVKIIFFMIPNVNIYYTVGVLFTISKKSI